MSWHGVGGSHCLGTGWALVSAWCATAIISFFSALVNSSSQPTSSTLLTFFFSPLMEQMTAWCCAAYQLKPHQPVMLKEYDFSIRIVSIYFDCGWKKKNENPVSGSIPCLKQGFMVGFFFGGVGGVCFWWNNH